MTNYTPTTEEVRHQYSYNIVDKWHEAERVPEFERWLFHVTEDAYDKGYADGLSDGKEIK